MSFKVICSDEWVSVTYGLGLQNLCPVPIKHFIPRVLELFTAFDVIILLKTDSYMLLFQYIPNEMLRMVCWAVQIQMGISTIEYYWNMKKIMVGTEDGSIYFFKNNILIQLVIETRC